jgi:hypothetical protein
VLVVLDGFSKFVTMYPVRIITSDALVSCLAENYFPCFEVPRIIVSDKAAVFKSRLFCNTYFSWGIRHVTSPYYPQASQVERFNGNLKVALTIYHNAHHTRWDEHLPFLAIAFNTAWHENTDSTPSLLFLGRELSHPLGLKWKLSELELQQSPQDTHVYWERALANLKKVRDRVVRRYTVLRSEAAFKVGDLMLVKLHPLRSKTLQSSAKMINKWSSPLVTAKLLIKVTVQLANPDTCLIVRKAHVSQLKRCFAKEYRIYHETVLSLCVNFPPKAK